LNFKTSKKNIEDLFMPPKLTEEFTEEFEAQASGKKPQRRSRKPNGSWVFPFLAPFDPKENLLYGSILRVLRSRKKSCNKNYVEVMVTWALNCLDRFSCTRAGKWWVSSRRALNEDVSHALQNKSLVAHLNNNLTTILISPLLNIIAEYAITVVDSKKIVFTKETIGKIVVLFWHLDRSPPTITHDVEQRLIDMVRHDDIKSIQQGIKLSAFFCSCTQHQTCSDCLL
jgi:hypothetical protein